MKSVFNVAGRTYALVTNTPDVLHAFSKVFALREDPQCRCDCELAIAKTGSGNYRLAVDGKAVFEGGSFEWVSGLVMQKITDDVVSCVSGNIVAAHAVSVSLCSSLILLAGISGSGKTSLGLAFSKFGAFVGDECTFVDLERGQGWCEGLPFQLKVSNEKMLRKFGVGDALKVDGELHGAAYYYNPRVLGQRPTGGSSEPIRAMVFPRYDPLVGRAVFGEIDSSTLPLRLMGSLVVEGSRSAAFRRFVHMLSERSVQVLSVHFSDCDEAAELLFDYFGKGDLYALQNG